MSPGPFPDARETRDPAERERELFARLTAQVVHAKQSSPYFASLFAQVDAAGVIDRAALARLPLTRKSQRKRSVTGANFGQAQRPLVDRRLRTLERGVDGRDQQPETPHHPVHALQVAARAHRSRIVHGEVIERFRLDLSRHVHEPLRSVAELIMFERCDVTRPRASRRGS